MTVPAHIVRTDQAVTPTAATSVVEIWSHYTNDTPPLNWSWRACISVKIGEGSPFGATKPAKRVQWSFHKCGHISGPQKCSRVSRATSSVAACPGIVPTKRTFRFKRIEREQKKPARSYETLESKLCSYGCRKLCQKMQPEVSSYISTQKVLQDTCAEFSLYRCSGC